MRRSRMVEPRPQVHWDKPVRRVDRWLNRDNRQMERDGTIINYWSFKYGLHQHISH